MLGPPQATSMLSVSPQPPMIETMDYRALPGGYGHGSSTRAAWILEQMAKEKEKTGQGTRCHTHSPH